MIISLTMSSSCFICKRPNRPNTLSGQSVLNRIEKFLPQQYDKFCEKDMLVNLSGRRYCRSCLCVTFQGWDKIPGLHRLRSSSIGADEEYSSSDEEEEESPPPKKAKRTTPPPPSEDNPIPEAVAAAINVLKNHPAPQVTTILTPAQKEEQMLLQIRKDLFTANYQKVGAGLNLIKIKGLKSPEEMKKLGLLLEKMSKTMEEAGIFLDE